MRPPTRWAPPKREKDLFEATEELQPSDLDDPFGDFLPRGYVPVASDQEPRDMQDPRALTELRSRAAKDKKKPQVSHTQRSIAHWEQLGYRVTSVDGWANFGGRFVKKDLRGLWDLEALKPGCARVLIQICSLNDRSNHIQKMTGDTVCIDSKRTRIDNLRLDLACGHECYLMLWDQPRGPGTAWVVKMERITEATIIQAIARRRGPRKTK